MSSGGTVHTMSCLVIQCYAGWLPIGNSLRNPCPDNSKIASDRLRNQLNTRKLLPIWLLFTQFTANQLTKHCYNIIQYYFFILYKHVLIKGIVSPVARIAIHNVTMMEVTVKESDTSPNSFAFG